MKLQKFLEENPIINKAELARRMFPDRKYATGMFNNKLKENHAGNSKQRITEQDFERAKEILNELSSNIDKL